ncbi:MAG: DUF6106 family protein [Roseburia sp.]
MGIFENTILVKKRASAVQLVLAYALLLLCFACAIGFLLCFQLLFVLLFLIAAILFYAVRATSRVEYEYSYIEGRLSFAKIKNKKRRKSLAVIEMETLQLIAPVGAPELRNFHENMNIIKRDYTSGEPDRKVYEAVYTQGESVVDILFEPDENMLDMMAHRYASRIKHESSVKKNRHQDSVTCGDTSCQERGEQP